ncbi:hypothetical protein QM646_50255, partial [Rhodococcus erythropolis]|nr:hypothetical protein [Rhodococcus erythropolis]
PVGGTAAVVVADVVVADDAVVDVTGVSDELQPANAPVTDAAKIAQAKTDLRGRAVTANHFLGQVFRASS